MSESDDDDDDDDGGGDDDEEEEEDYDDDPYNDSYRKSMSITETCNFHRESIDLVGGFFTFFFFHMIGNFIIPTDELIFFRRGRYTTTQDMVDGSLVTLW